MKEQRVNTGERIDEILDIIDGVLDEDGAKPRPEDEEE